MTDFRGSSPHSYREQSTGTATMVGQSTTVADLSADNRKSVAAFCECHASTLSSISADLRQIVTSPALSFLATVLIDVVDADSHQGERDRREGSMSEATADETTQSADSRPCDTGGSRKRPAYLEEEGAFPRLQERTQTQLGFINSLLITLTVGLLAFAVNASASSAELSRLSWRKWLLFAGLVALTLSVLSGLRLAHNRLASHRVTTRIARLRQLRDRYQSENRSYELRRLARQAVFFQRWAKYSLSKVPEKGQLHDAAYGLAALIPHEYTVRREMKPPTDDHGRTSPGETPSTPARQYISGIPPATTRLVEALRTWCDRADDWTWRWLRVQTWSFIIGAVLLLVVPVSYYFFKQAAR